MSCAACGNPASQRCGKCHSQLYCSRECQTKDWKAHRKLCKAATTTQQQPQPTSQQETVTEEDENEGSIPDHFQQRWNEGLQRISDAKARGEKPCEFLWEAIGAGVPCNASGQPQYAEPKYRECGHTICGEHLLLHGVMMCAAGGYNEFGFTSTSALEIAEAERRERRQ